MSDTSTSQTSGTSEQKMNRMERLFSRTEVQLITEEIKTLLIWAYESYDASFREGDIKESMYWDGYIRALHHVLEGVGQ